MKRAAAADEAALAADEQARSADEAVWAGIASHLQQQIESVVFS